MFRVGQAVQGGVRILQYRDKGPDPSRRAWEVTDLVNLCHTLGVPLIVNDDVALAHQTGAGGVHLGRDDPGVAQAREILGEQAIIGVSCYNRLEQAIEAQQAGADYVAFGRFFPSVTKPDAVRAGAGLLREASRRLSIPIIAIGGITPENGASLIEAGADALAVVHGVFGQDDITAAAARYAALFE